ncbi:MAG TPA: FtsW/RodA/SpoVE family cell cycle protein [Acidimicrobiales bacterium]|jgi:peptidoglycan glycosyltransferase|nr:FtsW/RodA/SpoVE family cell cycle protein [Acidimicrobiales bacterium]
MIGTAPLIGAVRRNTELGLLVLGTMFVVGAYVLTTLPEDSPIPTTTGPFLAIIVGLPLAAHVAVRRLAPRADGMLLPLASLLNGLGYIFIVRIDEARADPGDLAGLQSVWMILGVGAFVATLVVVRDVRVLERYRYTAGLAGIVLLLLPLVPVIGRNINGSRIWVSIGPVNFQPGEFAKLALAVFFAGYLWEKRELLAVNRAYGPVSLPDPKHLGPVLLAWGASLVVMVMERDLGSSLLFFTLFLVLIWVATERASYLVLGVLMFAGGAWFAFETFGHVQERVDTWFDPWGKDGGFQVVQAAFALADGGLTGTGPALGSPTKIPVVESDMIFAAIGEELGLLGATAVLIAFLLMVGAGLRIAQQAARGFERLLATGLTALLGFQAFIIMAGVVRLLPLTGVTLPFVSYGGSSLLANYVLLALLLRISHDTAERRVARLAAQSVTEVG